MFTQTRPLARVTPGRDCTAIPAATYDPQRAKRPFDPYYSTHRSGPAGVKDMNLDWFAPPRSMVDGLRLAFGDRWRIDLLPSTQENAGLFLLTRQWTGWRLMVRLGVGGSVADPMTVPPAPPRTPDGDAPVGAWCSHPTSPRGDDLREATERATSTAVRRKGWLARAVRGSTVATPDLRAMMEAVGIRPEQPPAAGDGLDEARLLCGALVEVWLAEHGYTGADAAAVRTLVALRGLAALDAFAHAATRTGTH